MGISLCHGGCLCGEVLCIDFLSVCVLVGCVRSLLKMVRHLGSSLPDIISLHICGLGLFAIMKAYSWCDIGWDERSEL